MHSGKLLALTTAPKVCQAEPGLQLQQSHSGQVLDSLGRPLCPRQLVSPGRQHDFSIRLRRQLQNSIGSGRYLAVFLTGGFAGFVLSFLFMRPSAGMVGASAAIFSVAACVMLVRPLKFSWLFLAPQGLVAIIYFLYNVAVVYDPRLIGGYDPQVGYVPHIIGFVTGLSFGIAWSANRKRNFLISIALLGIYVTILTIAISFLEQ
jgi:hypothetical protein